MRAWEGQLVVDYSAEIPIGVVMRRFATLYGGLEEVGEKEDREFAATIFAELSQNLTLLIDGEMVDASWVPIPDVPNGVASERFFVYHLRAEIPRQWAAEPTTLLLINDNYRENPAYFSCWVFPGNGVQVVSTTAENMGAEAAGSDVSNVAKAWSLDPIYRDLEAVIAAKPTVVAANAADTPAAQDEARDSSFPWWILLIPLPPLAIVVVRKFLASCN